MALAPITPTLSVENVISIRQPTLINANTQATTSTANPLTANGATDNLLQPINNPLTPQVTATPLQSKPQDVLRGFLERSFFSDLLNQYGQNGTLSSNPAFGASLISAFQLSTLFNQSQAAQNIGGDNFSAAATQGQATQLNTLISTLDTISSAGSLLNTVA